MPDDIAKIAAGLSEAQKAALTGGRYADAIALWTHARTRACMQDKGLVERLMYSVRLTPLGQQVRTYLENSK